MADMVEVLSFTEESYSERIDAALRKAGIAFFISGRDNLANLGLPKRVMVEAARAEEAKDILKEFGA